MFLGLRIREEAVEEYEYTRQPLFKGVTPTLFLSHSGIYSKASDMLFKAVPLWWCLVFSALLTQSGPAVLEALLVLNS